MISSIEDRNQLIYKMINPSSIAIIGASEDFNKVSGRPLKHLLEKGYKGDIYPVNPKYAQISGFKCYSSIDNLPQTTDLAIIALPAEHVTNAIKSLGERGIRSAVVFSSGFGEMGASGKELEHKLAEQAHKSGVIICGPNCLGFINAFENVYATFSQYADGDTGPGSIAFVTQSGAFGTAIAALARQRGLSLGYFINTGNQIDLTFSELMLSVIEDPRIRVAAGYLEGLDNGEALVRLAKRCQELKKPLVLTKVGRKELGARAAASHTGALAVEDDVFDSIIRQYGVLRAQNEEQMLDMLEALNQERSAKGSGLAIVTQSGGAGVMMVDRAEELNLSVPELDPITKKKLNDIMPTFGSAGNPVDITGQFVARPELLSESVVAVMNDPNVDIGIVWIQLMNAHVTTLVNIFKEIQARTTKPILVCWVAAPAEALKQVRELGIAVFTAGERAVEAASSLVRFHNFHERMKARKPRTLSNKPHKIPEIINGGVQDTVTASKWLSDAGVTMAPFELATNEEEAVSFWRTTRGAIALKIESPDIPHKTEIGGVLLNVDDEVSIRKGFQTLIKRAKTAMPEAKLNGVLVQKMSQGDLEIVIGVKRDPVFGMVIMVGLGGILVEILKDVSFRHAPFDTEEGLQMLTELRMNAMLDGVRGKPPVDRNLIAQTLSNLSEWAYERKHVLAELDLNPILINSDGLLAVDCVMVLSGEENRTIDS